MSGHLRRDRCVTSTELARPLSACLLRTSNVYFSPAFTPRFAFNRVLTIRVFPFPKFYFFWLPFSLKYGLIYE